MTHLIHTAVANRPGGIALGQSIHVGWYDVLLRAVGEHWLTDVIGGYLLGSLWLIVTIGLYEWGKARFIRESKSS